MATTTTQPDAAADDDPCVVLRGIGRGGYNALLKLRGERSSPKMIYLDGDLYLVDSAPPVEFRDVGWDGYRAMLRLRGERSVPKIIYLDGSLLLVSPSQPHEQMKKRFGMFVQEIVAGLGIFHVPIGEMTLRRRARRGGIDGDEAYYIANAERVRGKRIDLRTDPPPDLAIEVVHSHPAKRALTTYRRLRVPEVWVGDEDGVTIYRLEADGRYAESPDSAAFPFLPAAEINEWMGQPYGDETAWILAVRRWVQETLAPRV